MAEAVAAGSLAPVVVWGGGRWARLLGRILDDELQPGRPLVFVSPRNAAGMASWAAAQEWNRPLSSESTIDLTRVRPAAALVVNAARDHVSSAAACLRARVPVLVEKPLALHRPHARMLARLAATTDTLLWPATVLSHDAFLQHAASVAGPVHEVRIVWHDPSGEVRAGEAKRHDRSISVVEDAGVHVWSLLQLLGLHEGLVPRGGGVGPLARGADGRDTAVLELEDLSGAGIVVDLARGAPERLRTLIVSGARRVRVERFGDPLPELIVDGRPASWPDAAVEAPRPLTTLVRQFLSAAGMGPSAEAPPEPPAPAEEPVAFLRAMNDALG